MLSKFFTLTFLLYEFHRSMDNIRGFSRQTFIEVTANIESQEYRRLSCNVPEHPRAGTTDDVECFFAMCHSKLGDHFLLKDFKYNWKKLTRFI